MRVVSVKGYVIVPLDAGSRQSQATCPDTLAHTSVTLALGLCLPKRGANRWGKGGKEEKEGLGARRVLGEEGGINVHGKKRRGGVREYMSGRRKEE